MRLPLALAVTLLALPVHGYTLYGDLASWQAAVGAHQVEDFESYPEAEFPQEGGQIPLAHFTLEADDNGDDEWGPGGIADGNDPEFYSGPTLGKGFLTTIEICETCGPSYERAIFAQPIIGVFLDVPWSENGYITLVFGGESVSVEEDDDANNAFVLGLVFDEPLTTIDFRANHTWVFIDTLYFATVPEPGTGLLLAAGLALVARQSRRRA